MLAIRFWDVLDNVAKKINSIIAEVIYPHTTAHDHSVDEFSVSATDTYRELKAFIDKCVADGMGHDNTFIQVKKFAREELVPRIEKELGKKISLADT